MNEDNNKIVNEDNNVNDDDNDNDDNDNSDDDDDDITVKGINNNFKKIDETKSFESQIDILKKIPWLNEDWDMCYYEDDNDNDDNNDDDDITVNEINNNYKKIDETKSFDDQIDILKKNTMVK